MEVRIVYKPAPDHKRRPYWRRKPFVLMLGKRPMYRLRRAEVKRLLGSVVDGMMEQIGAEVPK